MPVFSEVGILYWRDINISTCNRLNVFAGPFTESVDWFPIVSFYFSSKYFGFDAKCLLMPVFSEVGILYWRDTDLFVTKK